MVIWAIFLLSCAMLTFASIMARHTGAKLGALSGLAALLIMLWAAIYVAFADLASHFDLSAWPSPVVLMGGFLSFFIAVAAFSFLRPHWNGD